MTLDPRITFSRASLATYFDATGRLRYANHNRIFRSEDFASTSWVKNNGATVTANVATAPDGTTTATLLNHVTAGTVAGGNVTQSSFEPPYRAVWSAYAKAGSKNFLVLGIGTTAANLAYFDLSTGTVGTVGASFRSGGIESVGAGWYQCWVVIDYVTYVVPGTSMTIRVGQTDGSITCTSPGDIFIWGAQYQWVTSETVPGAYLITPSASALEAGGPRFEYHPITHQPLGLLIEDAKQNTALQSQHNTATAWVKTSAQIDADVIDAPDGGRTGDLMTATGSPASTRQALTQSAAYTVSVFAKRGTSDWIYLVGMTTDSPRAWFNLATGVVGTVEAGLTGASIRDVGNGWYRCAISDVGGAGNEGCTLGISDADNSATVTVGKTIYLWGWQNEAGALTSYIPCHAPALARAVDAVVMTGTDFSSWHNQPAGTFIAEFVLVGLKGGLTKNGIISANNAGSQTNQLSFAADNTPSCRAFTSFSSTAADFDTGAAALDTTYSLGMVCALNDAAACRNGGTVLTDTTAVTPPTPTQLQIGFAPGNLGNSLNGYLRRIRFYNVRKSNAELVVLTALEAAGPIVALAWTTDQLDTTPSFTATFSNLLVGDVLELQVDNDPLFGSLHDSESVTLDASMIAGSSVTMGSTISAIPLIGKMHNARIKATRGGALLTYSDAPQKFITQAVATFDGTPSNATLSSGNRTVAPAVSTTGGVRSLTNKASGKYYFEVVANPVASAIADGFGIATAAATYADVHTNRTNGCYIYAGTGNIWSNNANTGKSLGVLASATVAGYLGIAIDQDNHRGWFKAYFPSVGLTSLWNNDASADPATNVGGVTIASAGMEPILGHVSNATARSYRFNFGDVPFYGDVPGGFTAGWPI